MHLSFVDIANYRGLRRLRIDFDRTTVVIGENDFGKTSLVDLLHACLGHHGDHGDTIRIADEDIHVPADGSPRDPAVVQLVFRERREGEWETSELEGLASAMVPGRNGRELHLTVTASPRLGEEPEVTWALSRVDGATSPAGGRDPLLEELRRLSPILVARWDRFSRIPKEEPEAGDTRDAPPAGTMPDAASENARLTADVESVYRQLVSARAPIAPTEVDRGIDALRQLFALQPDLLEDRPRRRRKRDMVVAPLRNWPAADRKLGPRGSGLDHLAVIALAGMLLEARGQGPLPRGAEPILIIEEPEAHLHLTTLSSVMRWIDQLNAQKILTTYSPDVLGAVPLRSIRRLSRREGQMVAHRIHRRTLSLEDQRRVAFHLRVRRGSAFFARCWLLMEGETEFWLAPELARLCGYDLASESVACVDFAQCGVAPLVKLAKDLGIAWHLLSDGDPAGQGYGKAARDLLDGAPVDQHITVLPEVDIEHHLWAAGYDDVYRRHAFVDPDAHPRAPPGQVIDRAVHAHSKPYLALEVMEAMQDRDAAVPGILAHMIETAVALAAEANPLRLETPEEAP